MGVLVAVLVRVTVGVRVLVLEKVKGGVLVSVLEEAAVGVSVAPSSEAVGVRLFATTMVSPGGVNCVAEGIGLGTEVGVVPPQAERRNPRKKQKNNRRCLRLVFSGIGAASREAVRPPEGMPNILILLRIWLLRSFRPVCRTDPKPYYYLIIYPADAAGL